ncbi:putative gustatory receptor 28b [Linepithema humile]|uniref:putative gustatory receptor 28b n=1 Tax=Linepithema humile TaxID=83485 RepID=UPI00351ED6BE
MIMALTIQHVLRPFFITCFIVGLGFYPIADQKLRWIAYLNIPYSLTFWSVYGYFLYYAMITFTYNILYSTLTLVVMGINILTTCTSVIMNLCYRKRFDICLKKLAAVDDTLEELGTSKMYREINMWSKRMIICWIVCSLLINSYDMMWWVHLTDNTSWEFLVCNLLNHCHHLNTFMDLLFISILWYIGSRFDKVNEHLQSLLKKEEHELRCRWKKPAIVHQYSLHINNYKRTLWILMHLYLELCRIARDLNVMFGIQLTLEMTSYVIYLTSQCHVLCIMWLNEHRLQISLYNWIGVACWVFVFIVRLYGINYTCENVRIKANMINKLIYKMTDTIEYANVWKETYHFILQAMQNPLKFSGMGLFYFGNEYLRKLCTTVVTFIIILTQFNIYPT